MRDVGTPAGRPAKTSAPLRTATRLAGCGLVGAGLWLSLFAGTPGVAAPTDFGWSSPTLVAPADTVSFANQVLPIFEAKCSECHGSVGDDGEPVLEEGLDLRTYEAVMAGSTWGTVVEPGDLDGSLLYEMVANGDMPEEGPELTEEELKVVADWITAGAPNN